MASRLTAEKNIGSALLILRDIVLKHKDVGLVIVGEGPEKRYLQGLVLKYHLDRNVVFESWQQDLASYYRTADVFLTTSLFEGYGLTLVEAAASGCPIITSDVGIARTIIQQGQTGFICSVKNPSEFTEKCLLLIEQEDLHVAMKHAAQEAASKRVSLPKADYLRLYKEAIELALKSD